MFGITEAMARVLANERKADACSKDMRQWCDLEYRTVIRHG